jgi:uncharacterized protein (TIGR03083 family)
MDIDAVIAAERRRLAGLLAGLNDAQWATPSLCAGWTVRHVAAHLITPFAVAVPKLVLSVLRTGSVAGAMDRQARRLGQWPTAELVATLERHAETRFRPPGGTAAAPLTDILVHGMDIRWPLGRADDRPDPQHLRPVLELLTDPAGSRGLVPRGRTAGVRLVATDVDWAHGSGPEIRGAALPLALGVLGRDVARPELTGDGLRNW